MCSTKLQLGLCLTIYTSPAYVFIGQSVESNRSYICVCVCVYRTHTNHTLSAPLDSWLLALNTTYLYSRAVCSFRKVKLIKVFAS